MFEFVVFFALFATLLAALIYIRSMFKGQTKPNRVTFFMWMLAPFIATAAATSEGAGLAALPVFMAGLSPLLILLASFFTNKAYWKLTRFDYLCGAISVLTLILWYVTKNPNLAITFAMFSDAFAAIPTMIKAWHNPETESAWPFIIGIFSSMTSFLVATAYNFAELAFPSYLIVLNIFLVYAILRGKVFRVNH